MRIAELHLERYGRFEDCRLAFPEAERDFHLVYGPNEAGKTTTLAAVSDLLFGFRLNRAEYDFRFDAPLLRVGATLEGGDDRLVCRRRRARQRSLVDGEDSPIDEGPLLAMLHGQTRETYRLSSSLDHERLREGGRAMVESKDDLGQALFAAGAGLTGLRKTIAALDQEIDTIWGPRRSDKRTYTQAEKAFEAARAALRNATLRPTEWVRARDELRRLEEENLELENRRRALSQDLAAVERLRRVYEPMRRRAILIEEREGTPCVVLPELIESAAASALAAAAEAERGRETAVALLSQARERLDAEPADPAALALEERVEQLVEGRGAEIDRRDQLPRREADLETRRLEAAELARALGLAFDGPVDLHLPAEPHVASLRRLATRYTELNTLDSSRRAAVETVATDLARANEALAGALPPEGLDGLEAAVEAAKRAGDVDARLHEREVQQRRAEEMLSQAFARLAPWTGDAGALASMAPIADAALESARQAMEAADRELADARRGLQALGDEQDRASTQAAALGDSGQAVSFENLSQARAERDGLWSALRDHIAGQATIASPQTEVARFEGASKMADELADRRFGSAQTSARLVQLEEQLAGLTVARTQAEAALTRAQAAAAAAGQAWEERTRGANNPPLPPAELRAWLGLRAAALEEVRKLQEAQDAAANARRQRDETRLALLAALNGAAESEPETSVSAVLARAELKLAELRSQGETFAECRRDFLAAQKAQEHAARQLADAERERRDWQAAWDAALAEAGLELAPQAADLRLGVVETLRGKLAAIRELEIRIAAMRKDAARFADEAAAAATLAGINAEGRDALELVAQLRDRLAAARHVQARRSALEAQIAAFQADLDGAQAALNAAEASLAEARSMTDSTDRAALATALERSRDRRKLEASITEAEREIAEHADGLDLAQLEADCAGLTRDDLAERARSLQADLEAIRQTALEAERRAAEAKLRFDDLDSGAVAADAAAEMEQARAEMELQGELYVLKRAQRIILDWAVRRHAEQRRNPMLARAADLFRILTLGCYADLRADYDAEHPRLLGMRDDEAAVVPVEDMSEGTQDQLFLALRLAAVEQSMGEGVRLPFLADDLFVSFDDDRARAGLQVLGELSRSTQVLFFTHHAHLKNLAMEVFGDQSLSACELAG